MSLVLVVAIFYYLLRGIDLALVWAEIRAMTWREDAILAVIAAWNLATYALVWMSVTPGLSFGRAMVMTQAATAVTNTVSTVGPAIGVGLTYQMLGSWGIRQHPPAGLGAGEPTADLGVQRLQPRRPRPYFLDLWRRPVGVRHGPSPSLALGAAGTIRPAGGNPTASRQVRLESQ